MNRRRRTRAAVGDGDEHVPGARKKRGPLFGAAVLKVSFTERAAAGGDAFREIYEGVLADLGITDEQVDAYLAEHRAEVLEALAGKSKR